MRVLHTGDLHIGLRRFDRPSQPAHDFTRDVCVTLIGYAAIKKPDVVVLAGDTFHSRDPQPRELALLATTVRGLRETGAEVIILPGNHDGPWVIGQPQSHTLRWLEAVQLPGVHVPLHPQVVLLKGGLPVLALPYPHRRAYDHVEPSLSPLERQEALSVAVGDLIAQMVREVRPTTSPLVFVGHLTVAGATVGAERTMRLEDDITVSVEALEGIDYAALGHIHKQQRVGPTAYYAGSPEYVDFGEVGQPKGFLLADVERDSLTVTTLPAGNRELFVTATEEPPTGLPQAAIVQVRLRREAPLSPASRKAIEAAYLAQGCSYVEVVVEVTAQRAAAERAMPVTTLPEDAVRDYLVRRGIDPEPLMPLARELMSMG